MSDILQNDKCIHQKLIRYAMLHCWIIVNRGLKCFVASPFSM